jgi:cytochrome c oxidase subunit 2
VTGHQWWWEFDYQGMNILTGNELHIPVGEPVHLDLRSADVIHSFWVPSLQGKRDAIPGHDNTLWLSADKPGTYRGECTEFCGPEHANMNFIVVAQPRAEFDAWVAGQQRPAATGQTGLAAEGAQTILTQACAGCHTINGLPGYNVGKVGPNLTHIGSRAYIAAGTLENTPENLARWIRNPQDVKPDNKMPTLGLDEDTINKIVAYLESLK